MEDIQIITLEPRDWEHYKDLRLRALKEEPQAFSSTYADNVKNSDAFWMERLKDAAEEKKQWMVFAKRDEVLVGMATAFAEKEVETAHVGAVYVVPEERGKGISKLLMQELLIKIKRNPLVKTILVEVNSEQQAAYNLYKNSGFAVTKKYRRMLGDEKEHDIIQLHMQLT